MHLSAINTCLSLAPRVANSAKKRSILCLVSINYCHIPSVTQVRPHGNLCVISDGAVWSVVHGEATTSTNTRLSCDPETRGTLRAGRQSSEQMPIFTDSPLNNVNKLLTSRPVFLCSAGTFSCLPSPRSLPAPHLYQPETHPRPCSRPIFSLTPEEWEL